MKKLIKKHAKPYSSVFKKRITSMSPCLSNSTLRNSSSLYNSSSVTAILEARDSARDGNVTRINDLNNIWTDIL